MAVDFSLYRDRFSGRAWSFRPTLRRARTVASAVAGLVLLSSAEVHSTEAADQLLRSSEMPGGEVAAVEDEFGWVAMPIPVKNPTVGTGLAAVGMLTYSLDDGSPASSTAVFGGRTDNGSWKRG